VLTVTSGMDLSDFLSPVGLVRGMQQV
jgi:hypothetical protein